MPVVLKLIPRRRNTWVEVVPEEGASLKLPRAVLPAAVRADAQLDEAHWRELADLADYHGLLDTALRLLGRREHFERELERKLRRRTADRDLVARVLAECRCLAYLDDERAAVYAVQQLLNRGGLGLARLRQELSRRGCPPALARRVLAEQAAAYDEQAELSRLLRSRERSLGARADRLRVRLAAQGHSGARLAREVERRLGALVQNYLAGRGFSGEQARQAAAELVRSILPDQAEE
jgi:SOS response regulatory protein OraA/RecX